MTIIQRSLGRLSATTLVALLLTALFAPGCTKERPSVEDPAESPRYTTDDWEGSTYMSLALRTTPPTTDPSTQQEAGTKDGKESKTGGEDFTTWQGDDIIDNFAVFIVSEGIDEVQCIAGSVNDESLATWDPKKQELRLTPFSTAPVSKRIFAFFNIPEPYLNKLKATVDNKRTFLEEIVKPIDYMGEQGITYDGDAPMLEAFRPDSHIATKEIAIDDPSPNIPDLPSFTASGRPGYPLDRSPRRSLDFPTEFFDQLRMAPTKPDLLPFIKRKDRILSSGVRYNYLPEDYVTEEEVKNGRNLVQVYTRRVLAQAVVTAEADLAANPISALGGMVIKGMSFQVFNFEPTFYPIAKTTKEGEWPGNKNTVTPLYEQKDNSSLINMKTYRPTIADEEFTADALVRDRFFRSAHFVYEEAAPAELDPTDKDYAQKLLREARIERKGTDQNLFDGRHIDGVTPPRHGTTFWGSCYVTESTHAWAEDGSSGYTTSNTPFFAVIASFDMRTLPWADFPQLIVAEKNSKKDADFKKLVKDLKDQLQKAKDELAAIPDAGGGGMSEADADAVFKTYEQWLIDHHNPILINNGKLAGGSKSAFNSISRQRNGFKAKSIDEKKYLSKIKRSRNNLRSQCPGINGKSQVGSPTEFDAPDLDDEQKAFKKTLEADRKLRAGDPYADKRTQLSKQIKDLEKQIEDAEKDFFRSDGWYPSEGDRKELFTPSMYEQGITRVYYSLADYKFYLNYHEIPKDNRGSATHTLSASDPWLKELKSKLPNGKDFPTETNGVSKTNAVLPPDTPGLMERLSKLLNGQLKETDLSIAERHSMDFYLYGRIAPGLKKYFYGATADPTEPVDIHSGYVTWYTADKKDNVVSYPCYIRKRTEDKNSIYGARLLMVYYAWLNPNAGPDNSYASPVLRNNIYHMHITGFTKMGLSAIPFVPNIKEGKGYKFLHAPLDPDETVPGPGAPLSEAKGSAGQATSQSMPRSASYSITF